MKKVKETTQNFTELKLEMAEQQNLILKFLNSIAIPSADKSDVDEFSKTLLKAIKEFTGAALATFSCYHPDKKELLLLHIETEQDILKTVLKIAGNKIVKTASPVDDEAYKLITKKIVGSCSTLTEVTFGAIPKLIDKAIRTSTSINRFFPIAHVIKGELYGTTMLAFKKGQTTPSIELLESYAHLMSVSLRRYNTEKALQDSEKKYRTLAENAIDFIWEVDLELNTKYASPAVYKITGYTEDEMMEMNAKEIFPEDRFIEITNMITEQISLKELHVGKTFESEYICKNGKRVPVEISAKIIWDKNFKPTGISGRTSDITERKQTEEALKESEERFKQATDSSGVWIWEVDAKGLYTYISNTEENILGYKTKNLIGKKYFYDYFVPEEKERLTKGAFEIFSKKEKFKNFVNRNIHKDGREVILETSGIPLLDKDGNLMGYRGADRDITDRVHAEKELIKAKDLAVENEAKFKELFVKMMNAFALHEMIFNEKGEPIDYKFLDVNPAWEKLVGIKAKMVINKTVREIMPDIEDRWIQTYGKVVTTGISEEFEDYNKATHKYYHVFAYKTEPGKFAVLFNDITVQKIAKNELIKAKEKAEENEEKFRTVFKENNSVQLLIAPETGRIVDANQAACQFYGYSINELTSIKIQDINQLSDKEIELEMQKAKELKLNYFEFKHKLSDGTIRDVEVSSKPIRIDNKKVLISIIHDITDRKLARETLIKAKEKAEESDRLKSAFLANMSHEIRTPMNGILGFANLLQEPNLSGKEKGEFIDLIQKSGNRMLNTVNDLIDISRVETGQVELSITEFNICEEINSHFSFFKPEADKKGLKLILKNSFPDCDGNIKSDLLKLNSIFNNLIKNAIKFTDKGVIEIGANKKDNQLECYVKDTGIGIPKNRQKAVFDRFVQSDITDKRAFEGSGLGLAITKAYVEILGGKLWLESKEGYGSTFYFNIPFENSETNKKEETKQKTNNLPETASNKIKVLIAEDDELSFQYLSIILSDLAEEIIRAKTGLEAIEICKKNPNIDIVFMDIKMPELNGYEATKKIREFNKEVVIIAQTAFALSGDQEKSLEVGCNDYISKPIDKTKLREVFIKWIN